MTKPAIIRRRKLGKTSCNNIAELMQHDTTVVRNWCDEIPKDATHVFRWGCTSTLEGFLGKVFNPAVAIHRVCDKRGFRELLNDKELCPETWFDFYDLELRFGQLPCDQTVVLRTSNHAQGRGLWVYDLSDDIQCEELEDKCLELGPDGYYINEFIPKVTEYRVFVAQGRAVWVAQKTPGNPDDVAWNVAKGGRFDNVRWGDWPISVVDVAIKAHNISRLDFSGVDVMVDGDGKCYVLEINSAPSQTSPYRQSCVAKVFDWMVKDDRRKTIPVPDVPGRYLKYIHPAIDSKAKE